MSAKPASRPSGDRPTVADLAERLREDIRQRNLQPGDAYFNAADAARFLGVGTSLANRALQLLETRQLLRRSQRRGAILLPPVSAAGSTPNRILLLVGKSVLQGHRPFFEGLRAGLGKQRTQLQSLPEPGASRSVDSLISDALASREPTALGLVAAPLEVARQAADSGLPAALLGAPHPSVTRLPSLEPQWAKAVAALLDHFIAQGCRHLAVFMREGLLPEDHRLLDAVGHAAASRGIPPNYLFPRSLPPDREVCRGEARRLLEAHPRTGFLCPSRLVADAVAASATRQPGLAAIADPFALPDASPYPRIIPAITPQEAGERLADLLEEPDSPASRAFPLRLYLGSQEMA